jgi:membrane protease YdiL (CAAX protease family)
MKKACESIGKAICYFIVFFIGQLIVSVVAVAIVSFQEGVKAGMSNGGELDVGALTNQISEWLMKNAMFVTLFSSLFTLAFVFIFFAIRKKNTFKEVSLNKVPISAIPLVVILAFSFQFIASIGLDFLPIPQEMMESFENNVLIVTGKMDFLSVVIMVLFVPITEEIIFRGLIFTRLKRGLPFIAAVIIQAVLFGILHMGIFWIIQAFIIGVLFALLFEKFESLWASVIAHIGLNLSAVILISVFPGEMDDTIGIVLFVFSVLIFAVSFFAIIRIKKQERVTG